MNVFHFCPSVVELGQERGGVSHVVASLAQEMSAAGHVTRVICGIRNLGRVVGKPGEFILGPDLVVHRLDDRVRAYPDLVRRLNRLILEIPRGSIAHVHGCFSVFAEAVMRLLRSHNVPYLVSPHGKLSIGMMRNRKRLKRAWFNTITRGNLERAAAIGMLANGEERDLRLLGVSNRCVVVPNGFKLPSEFRSRSPGGNEKSYIIFLGYLDPRKQPDFLIRAYSCSQARLTHDLILVGPDGYGFEVELRQIARDLGVSDRVRFLGSKQGVEKWELLSGASLLCLPSKGEGYPLVLVEAAAVGTPSLFSKDCNATALASAGAGIELEGSNVHEWARAIDSVLGDDVLSKRIRVSASTVSEEYTWKKIAKRWLDIYSDELKEIVEA